MKKSTKIIGIVIIACFIVIGIIGSTKHTTQTTTKKVNEGTEVSIKITGIDETLLDEKVEYQEETVYDLLVEICDENNLALSTKGSGSTIYISGIGDLHEFDHGGNSGWTYTVNGEYPPKSCGAVDIEEGDSIEWIYVYD